MSDDDKLCWRIIHASVPPISVGKRWDRFCEWMEAVGLLYLALPWLGLIMVVAAFNWLRTGSWEI